MTTRKRLPSVPPTGPNLLQEESLRTVRKLVMERDALHDELDRVLRDKNLLEPGLSTRDEVLWVSRAVRTMRRPIYVVEARYRHECPDCVFLGPQDDHDLYYCKADPALPLVGRFGHANGARVSACLEDAVRDPVLGEAVRRAERMGLLSSEPTGRES